MKKWSRKPPIEEEWQSIEPTVTRLYAQLRELESTTTGTTQSAQWPVFQLHHQRSRYLFDLYHHRKLLSPSTWQWLLEQGLVDGELVAKWKRQGYEGLCCLRCIQREGAHGTVCICRVPRSHRALTDERLVVECQYCGCRGCSG